MKTRLKEARNASGLSQQDAARLFSVSLGTYRNWEQGRVIMNGEQLIKAASIYGVTVDYLLMTDTEPEEAENTLVNLFRSMNDEGKSVLIAIAETLVGIFGDSD